MNVKNFLEVHFSGVLSSHLPRKLPVLLRQNPCWGCRKKNKNKAKKTTIITDLEKGQHSHLTSRLITDISKAVLDRRFFFHLKSPFYSVSRFSLKHPGERVQLNGSLQIHPCKSLWLDSATTFLMTPLASPHSEPSAPSSPLPPLPLLLLLPPFSLPHSSPCPLSNSHTHNIPILIFKRIQNVKRTVSNWKIRPWVKRI